MSLWSDVFVLEGQYVLLVSLGDVLSGGLFVDLGDMSGGVIGGGERSVEQSPDVVLAGLARIESEVLKLVVHKDGSGGNVAGVG